MGTESFIRKAAHRLVRRKQPLLECLECADAPLRVSGMAKATISPLKKPQGKELGKWHGSVSRVRRFLGRWSSNSLGPETHSGDTRNIASELGDPEDSEGNGRSLPTSSPRVPNLPAPQPARIGQSLHLDRNEDPVAHRREMKIAALEQVQIQEELLEAARLRGGCVPCSKGTVTIAPPQNTAPGLSILGEKQALGSQGEEPRPGPQYDSGRPRSEAGSRASQEPNSPSTMPQTRQRRLAIQGEGLSPPGRTSLQGLQSNTAPQIGSGAMEGNTLHDPGSH